MGTSGLLCKDSSKAGFDDETLWHLWARLDIIQWLKPFSPLFGEA
jgi:hypothetical protein